MQTAKALRFTRLSDGTILMRQDDGSFQPVQSGTNKAALAGLTEAAIEDIAANDPDHLALDEAFWAGVEDKPATKEAISIKLEEDILSYFRRQGRGYQTRINAVLRRYVDSRKVG